MEQIKKILFLFVVIVIALLYYGSTLVNGKIDEVKSGLSTVEQKIQLIEQKIDALEKNEYARVKEELDSMSAYVGALQKKLAD